MTPITKNLLSTKEASTWSGYHTDYIARLAKSGKISATRIGRSWLIDQESLAAFIESQEKRKKELSEILSRERIEEYQALTETGSPRPLREKIAPRTSLKKTNLLSFSSHSFALVVALFVVGSGMYLAGSGVLEKMVMGYGSELIAQATSTHERIVKTISSLALTVSPVDQTVATAKTKEVVAVTITPITLPGIYVSKVNSKLPITNSYLATTTNSATYSFETFATDISLASRRTVETISSSSVLSSTSDRAFSNARRTYLGSLTTLGTSLSSIGVSLRDGGMVAPSVVIATGNSIHSSVVATSESILEQYRNAIYTWAQETPSLPHKTASALLTFGLGVKNIVLETPGTIAALYEKSTYSFVFGSYHVVDTVTETERTIAENTLDKAQTTIAPGTIFLGTVIGQESSIPHARFAAGSLDAFLPQGSDEIVSVLHNNISALFETTQSAVASLFGTNNVHLAIGTEAFVPSVVYGGEETALFTYHTINELFRSTYNGIATIAGLFTPQKIAIIPAVLFPNSVISDSNSIPSSSATSTVQTVIGTGGSLIQKITNYYSTINGITNSYLEQRLAEVSRDIVIQILDRRGGQGGGGPVDLTHIDGSTITNSTFSGTSVTTTNLVVTNASTTNATTTNFVATNASTTNATTTNFFATNATSTNIYATNATFGNLYATILNLPDLIATNATTTNATSTNFFSTNASITNFVANLATVTDIIATNATTTNFVATNATSTNFFATNGTITNFFSTLATITGLNVTNSTSTNATSTNFFATNGTISNLFSTLATITGLTTTNATSTNLAISSLTQGRVPFVGVGGLLIDSANLLFDGITLTTNSLVATNATTTNATSTNFFATNGTISNLFSTLATITGLTATNSTTTNATTTNFFASNASLSNLFSTLATITGLNVTNSTTTNATSTNLFATNGTISNLFSTLATITGLTTTNSTSTNATSTNLFATNGTISNLLSTLATISGLTITNSTTTNATTTNFFASNASLSNLFSTLATITGLNVTNSTTTNATTTNFFAANATTTNFATINASTTNATTTNFGATNAVIANATSTNLFATNGTITNFLSTLATITGLNVTNSTTTNATTTNLFATNGIITNFLSTLATITGLTTTNATTTNLLATNATSTNLAIASLTQGRVPFVGVGGLLLDSVNLLFDGVTLTTNSLVATNSTTTNATSTNLFATNGTISNLFSTLATITGLNVTNSTTTNATTTNFFAANATTTNFATINASTTNATTTNFGATNAVIANATSTNLFATNGTITNFLSTLATITGLNVTNSTTTNATSTNLFATNGTISNLFSTLATISGLITTNSTTTNATSTNLFATNGTISNLFSTLATITGLNVTNSTTTNATTTNLFATNGTISNFFSTLATITGLNVTNSTTTNATTTNLFATNGTISNLLSTLATISGLTTTNSTTTNATSTNLFATNGTISNLTTNTVISSNSSTTNSTTTNFFATNATTTNFYSTNGTIANFFSTLASITGLTTTNSTTTNATSTNLFATNGTITNFLSTLATITGLNVTNSTTTNATSTNLFATNGTISNLFSTLATISGLITTNSTTTNATSTNLFATNGTISNLFATLASTTALSVSNLTNGRVTYAGIGGVLQDSANLTFNGTTLTANTLNLANALGIAYGGTGTTTQYTNGVNYFDGSKITSGGGFVFTGTNVGIGSTTPSAKLSVKGAGTTTGINFQTTDSSNTPLFSILDSGHIFTGVEPASYGKLHLYDSGTTTSFVIGVGGNSTDTTPSVTLAFRTRDLSTDTGSSAEIVTGRDGTYSSAANRNANLQFWVESADTLLERMRITATGNIGIGSTSPSSKLVVVGETLAQYFTATSTTNANTFPLASTTALTNTSALYNTYLTTNRVPYTTTAGLLTDSANLTFNGTTLTANTLNLANALGIAYGGTGTTTQYTNGVNYFDGSKITSGGNFVFDGTNVGIGTSSPSTTLEVYAAGSPGIAISNTSQQWTIQTRSDISNSFNIRNVNTPLNVFTITTAGNVGIGTTTPSAKLVVAGNQINTGYIFAGTAGLVPLNTSVGDVTVNRLNIGNAATFSSVGSGTIFDAEGTTTTSGAVVVIPAYVSENVAPTSDSSAQVRTFVVSTQPNSSFQINSITGGLFENRYRGSGTTVSLTGLSANALVTDSTSVNFSTITTAKGINVNGYSKPSGSATGSVTSMYGVYVNNPDSGLTITGAAGITVEAQTRGTNHTDVLLGTATIPSGTFGIYNASTNNNYFAGSVGIGTTSPVSLLEISGSSSSISQAALTALTRLTITNTNTTTNNYESLAFNTVDTAGAATTSATIMGVNTSHTAGGVSGDLSFLTNNGGSFAERMRLTTSGANTLLQLNGGTATNATTSEIQFVGGNVNASIQAFRGANSTLGGLYFNTRQSGTVTTAMTIDSSGNVGIGTTTPGVKLSVVGGGYFTTNITSATATTTLLEATTITSPVSLVGLTLQTPNATNAVNGVTVTTGSSVNSNGGDIILNTGSGSDASAKGAITFQQGGSTVGGFANNGVFGIGTNSFYVGSGVGGSPNTFVGIGSSTPYARLVVAGQTIGQYFTATSTTNANTFPLASTTALTNTSALYNTYLTTNRVPYTTTAGLLTDSANLTFNGTTLTANTLNLANALGIAYGGTGTTTQYTNGVNYFDGSKITSGGNFVFDGTNVGIGTSTPDNFLTVNSGTLSAAIRVTGTGQTTRISVENSAVDGDPVIRWLLPLTRAWIAGIDDSDNDKWKLAPAENSDFSATVLTVDVNGNVGIGSTSPSAKLVVAGQTIGQYFTATSTTNANTFPLASTTALTNTSALYNTYLTSGRVPYTTTAGLLTDSSNLTFDGTTLTANTLNLTNALGIAYGGTATTTQTTNGVNFYNGSAITSNSGFVYTGGNVGIGTSTPGALLDLSRNTSATAGSGLALRLGAVSTNAAWGFRLDTNNNLVLDRNFSNTWSQAFTFDRSSGELGIGTSSPSSMLHISDVRPVITLEDFDTTIVSGDSIAGFNWLSDDSDTGATGSVGKIELLAESTFGASSAPSALVFSTNTGAAGNVTERLRITSAGSVGIGTSTPVSANSLTGTLLQLGGSASNSYGNLILAGNATTGQRLGDISFQGNGGGVFYEGARIESNVTNGSSGNATLAFFTSSSLNAPVERMRITATGNIGIGSTSPSSKLVVVGETLAQYFTATSTTNANTFPLASTTALTNTSALYNTYLTTNRVPYTTTSGLLTDSANMTFNGTTFNVSGIISNQNITLNNDSNGAIEVKGTTAGVSSPYIDFGDSLASDYDWRLEQNTAGNIFSIYSSANSNILTLSKTSGNIGIGDNSPTALLTVGSGDLFQVNSGGAIAAATGITSSGTINFSGLTASKVVFTDGSKNLTSTGTVGIAQGGTNAGSQVTNGVNYYDGTSITSGSSLIFDGTNLRVNGAAATALFNVGGTYTTSNINAIAFGTTLASNATTQQVGVNQNISFAPTGGDVTSLYGTINISRFPAGSANITNLYNHYSRIDTVAGYTGTIATGYDYAAGTPTLSGSNPIGTFVGYQLATVTNGNGTTSGSISNYGVLINAITAAAGSGGTVDNRGVYIGVPSGNTSGTSNYGLYINGAGGTSATNNYSVYNLSTADSYFAGKIGIGTTTPTYALTVGAAGAGTGILLNSNSISSASPVVSVIGRRDSSNGAQAFSGGVALAKWSSGTAATLNERLGSVYFGGSYDGTFSGINYAASLSGVVESAFTATTSMSTGLAFYTSSSGNTLGNTGSTAYGTERLRITAGGNVGIGTSTPTALLQLAGAGVGSSRLWINNRSSGESNFDNSSNGLELTSGGMNTTSKYTPFIKFGSNDSDFATSSPQFFAAIGGRSLETYGGTTNSGMAIDFLATTTAVGYGVTGAIPTLTTQFTIDPTNLATRPILQINGDNNTGIYQTAADMFSITAGGVERIHIDGTASAGLVGIGTSTPDVALQVATAAASSANGQNVLKLNALHQSATVGSGARLVFAGGSANSYAEEAAIRSYTFGSSNIGLAFETGAGGPTVKMSLTGAGLLGLGTTTPNHLLEMYATSTGTTLTSNTVPGIAITNADTTTNNFAELSFLTADSNGSAFAAGKIASVFTSHSAAAVSGDLAFLTRNAGTFSEKMRILANGNVGVGSTTPGARLSVTGAGTTTGINFQTTDSSNSALFTILDSGNVGIGTSTPTTKLVIDTTTNGNGVSIASSGTIIGTIAKNVTSGGVIGLAIDASATSRPVSIGGQVASNVLLAAAGGNVGVGTTSVAAKLDIYGGNTVAGLSNVGLSVANGGDRLFFGAPSTGNPYIGVENSSSLRFFNGTTQTMTLTSAGNLGIGTTTPDATLNVLKATSGRTWNASTATVGLFERSQSSANPSNVSIISGNASTAQLNFGDTDAQVRGAVVYDHSVDALSLWTAGSQRFTVDSSGNVGIGSTSPSSLFAVAGTSTLRNIIPDGAYTGNMSAYNVGASNARWNAMWAGTYNVGTSTWSISATGTDRFGIFNAASAGGSEYLSILTASGNVGIGTTNPQATLDVNGSVYLSGRPALATDGTHTYVKAGTSGGIYFQPNNAAITAVSILSGGNVGIGTSTPSSKLSVVGDATYAGNAQLVIFGSTSPAKQLLIGFDTTSDYGFIQPVTQGSAYKNLLLNQSGGNVGIGTTTAPLYTLSVNSATGINTYDGVAGKGRLIFGDPLDPTGYVGIYRSALSTIGTAGNGLTLGAIDGIAFTTPGSNALSAQTERVRITAAGNVGIGSSAPLSKLDVSSTASAGDLSAITLSGNNASSAQKAYATLTGVVELNSAGNESGGFRINVLGNGSTRKAIEFSGTPANSTDYLAFFTNNGTERMRILSGGNIAIGTSSADAKLQVVGGNLWVGPSYGGGSAYDTGNRTLQVGAWTGTPAITLARHGVETFTASVLANGDTAFANAGGTRITLQTSTGNVGIGTTTPGRTLTVGGSLQLTGAFYDSAASAGTAGYILQSTGSATTWVATSTLNVTASAGGSNTQIQYNNSGSLAGSSGFVFSGGNVGIGTSTPGFALVVGAASSAAAPATSGITDSSQLANFYATNVGSGGYGLGIGVSNSTGASWLQSRKTDDFSTNTSLLLNPNGGNVGIGTTTPTLGTLEVDGTGTINTSSVTAFTVGSNGLTTPAFQVSASTTSMVTGLQVVSKAAASGLTLQTTSSGANEAVTLASKGTGSLNLTVNASNKIVAASASITYANVVNHSFSSFTASNTASTVRFSVANAADTTLTTAVEAPHTYFNLGTNTRTHAAGAITLQRDFRITGTTHAFASASTITDEAAFSVDGPASAGTNATITNAHGIYVPGVTLTGTITNSYGLTVKASSGATNNYAAVFTGGNVGIGTASPSAARLVVTGSTWLDNSSGDTGTRALGTTISTAPASNYVPGTDPGDSLRTLSVIVKGSTRPAILTLRNADNSGAFWDLVADASSSKFFLSTPGTTPVFTASGSAIGINTVTPQTSLDVAGSVAISGSSATLYPTSYQPAATLYLSEAGASRLPWIQFHASGYQEAYLRLATSSRTFELGDNQGNGVGLAILNNAGTSRAVSLSGNSLSYFNGGSLGVGTTTPVNLLDIATVQNAPTVFSVYNNNSSSAALSAIYLNNGTNKGIIAQTGTGWSGSYFANGTTSAQQMNIGTQASGVLTLGTANTARLTIESGGNIGIGTSTPRSLLEVNGDIRTNGNLIASTGATGASGSCSTGPGLVVVYQSGIVISCTSTPSDQRLKTVTGSLDGETSLEKISALSTIYYKWNATALAAYPNAGFDDTTNQLGFLAQNVQSVFPEAVTQQSNGYFQVDYSRMTVALASGISALTVRLDDIATTSDFETGSYAARFWDALTHRLITWFADTTNGIGDVFAKKVNTGELCVSATDGSQTCITKTQLDQLLAGAGASGSTTSGGSGGSTGGTTGGTTPENQNGQDGAPTITLNGSAAMNLIQGNIFTDPGATATDAEDGDMTSHITVGGSVDTATAGTYTLTYSVLDSAGHYAEVSRMVVVQSASSESTPDGGTSTPDSGTTGGDQTPVSADPGGEPTP